MPWDRDDLQPARPAYLGIPPEALADGAPGNGAPGRGALGNGALGDGAPAEAHRIGLSRHTEEGALVEFASSLNGAKPAHKLLAWLLLVAFAAPAVYTVLFLLF